MTGVAAEFVRVLGRIAAAVPIPALRALLLPATGEPKTRDAEFCAIELEDGSFGFSYVWLGDTLAGLRGGIPGVGLVGRPAEEIARWVVERDPARRALGFAALNAISQSLFRRAAYVPPDAPDSIGLLEPSPADHVGMVGLFPPLIERILAAGARLTVAELRPELAADQGRFRVTLDPAELATCNKVLSTSTVLLNDTLEAVLAACRNATFFSIIGPTAGCVPDPLFARGVGAVGGTRVIDAAGFREAMRRGEPWGACARKYCIRPADYPGLDALIERAR
ncbi:MAG: hypothetical protein Fur0039_13330 [Rhodocyclaceae bacterium]